MSEPVRTVRVRGLPVDIEDDRLKDKLFIHFLRTRNGGGEIESVSIVKATPVSALITFEDSRVAQSVIQHSRHILEVDGKKYQLVANVHRERLDPDKVILSLSATVNCSQLPGGVTALTNLQKSHPDILVNHDAAAKLCTLQGTYSKVHVALTQLLDNCESPLSAENEDSDQPATDGSRSVQNAQAPHTQESEGQSRKPNKQREERDKADTAGSSDEYNPGSYRDMSPGGYGLKDTGQSERSSLQVAGHSTPSEEDFLLIVDADMFQYVHKHCRKEYQQILSQYGVDVVDVTNEGLTSLFLQIITGVGQQCQDQECVKLARKAISSFFQENETKICRDQLPKNILLPRGGLQRAKENLSVRLPKLLLNEDDENIYVIGSSSDVSEAKQFFLDHNEIFPNGEDVASFRRLSSHDSGSSTHANEQRVPQTVSSTLDSVDDRIDQLLRSEEDDRRPEAAARYKLAARFKDSGLAALGSRPTDFTLRGGVSSYSRPTRVGPVLGHDVLSETTESPGERASRALAQNTGEDILFKSRDVLPSTAYMQNKTSVTSQLFDTRPKSSTSHLSTVQSSLSRRASSPLAGTVFKLKRASSFSGTAQQKAQVIGQKSQDDTVNSRVRARIRSSNVSNQTGKGKQAEHNAEIAMPYVLWQHIKDAHSARVDDLTSDVQVKVSRSEGTSILTLTLRGANSSKVTSCQQGLQKLLESVSADFSVQVLPLSELGITDAADETLQACCTEVRSRFKKVTVQFLKKSLFLLGPEQLCSQVGASLREIFSGGLVQRQEHQDLVTPSTSNWDPSIFLPSNGDQSIGLHCYSNPQAMLDSQTSQAGGIGSSQERRPSHESTFQVTELVNGSISQPVVRIDPVIKEKVKVLGAIEMDRLKTNLFAKLSKAEHDKSARHTDVIGPTATRSERTKHSTQKVGAQQSRAEIHTPEDSRSGLGGPGCICVCGETEKSMSRTKCGAAMCSKCLDTVHVHCRVCHVTDLRPRVIQGKMSYSKLAISVPGHKKDSAIKISYLLPDGIQEEGHPYPGQPFQGGLFEAFLPDCEKARKLLPRLEKAFRQGLTFTVMEKGTSGRVAWDNIPHKTSLYGGKSGNGYPDSTYFTRLSEVLTSHGIEEPPGKT